MVNDLRGADILIKRRRLNGAVGVALSLAVSLAAFAALNSAERKATREAQSVANGAAARVQKACGNSKFEIVFDWFAFKDLDYTRGGISRVEAMKKAGDRANRIGNAIVAVCADSQNPKAPHFKEALSQLTQVQLAPHQDEKNFRIEFSKQDSALKAQFGAFGDIATEDLTAEIRKQF